MCVLSYYIGDEGKTAEWPHAFLGTLGPFDPDSEDWTCYCERLEQFVGVNGINNADKKRAVLLSSCGSAVYQVIRNLMAPEKPADKSFSELVKLACA